ncbi:MAG: FlaD/FlaE family flagellar protein, partial [Halococcoides sp.]
DDDLLEEDADEMGIDEDELADDELFDTVVDDEPDVDSPAETNEEMAAESAEESTAESAEEGAVEADQASSPGTDGDGDDPGTAGDESTDAAPDQRSTSTDAGAATDSTGFTTGSTGGDGKPYVERLPGGPVREIVTVEWLESLVDRLGTTNTRQALQYYERIGWISSEVRADLEAYLQGIEGDGTGANPDIEVHTTSLEYIRELNGTGRSSPLGGGGDPDGIQR